MSEDTHHGDPAAPEASGDPKGRRDFIKTLATVPVVGALFYGVYRKQRHGAQLKASILEELQLEGSGAPAVITNREAAAGTRLRVGFIGFGFRGEQLARAAGFAHPDWIEAQRKANEENRRDTNLQEYYEQDDLNMEVTAVCDVFDVRAERGLAASANPNAKRYRHYQDLIAAPDVDAVIISTPDHWHAPMAIEAARAGKHVYLEKCMTHTIPETYALRDAVRESGVTFQVGHTGRQNLSYVQAAEVINRGILGEVTIVEMVTNRNNPFAAWIWPIHEAASPETIDWKQFLGPAPDHPFDLERFFQWRRWWDYGTGMSGDLLTHEFDAVNQIMKLGIPKSAVASGGIYYFKDGRTVPDVFHVTFEYPDRNLSLVYSGTLANGRPRAKTFMGHDASMEVGRTLTVNVDRQSTRYEEKMKEGVIDPSLPLISYQPGQGMLDAVTSATEKYFADRGLQYTYRNGRRVNTTNLHIGEWLDAIRSGTQPSCDMDQGFQEAITAHMATLAFKEGRRVEWDPVQERVI